ncbi:SLC13 family permease [uncultured Intestinimonas sp.]|uniref:SLC13 family permease n=1 Tax=uncultured Intestinimonas sp. TaxID=1689265 RepID=UPI0025ECB62D|nr:SLC13 family permease [uncultured Intestinimonas sp.]
MTATVGLIVFMLAIVISIILGTKLKMNIGMVALAFTFLIGVTLSGLSGRSVSGLFPTNIFVTQLVATFFYGFASLNGAFNGIADRIIYRTKKVKGALPFVVLLCTILLSMMGAGAEATPVIMSPIAFMLAAEAGFHPILASLAVWVGSVCTIGATWTPGGAVAYSIWSPHLGEEAADATSLYIMLLLIAIGFITMLVVDFIYRKDLKEIEMEEPAPFTPIQKRSLMIVVIALLLMLIPAVLEALAPNPVTKWISTHITVQVVCLVGSLIFVIMGLADPKEVFSKKIPWNSLITLAGMGTLVALAGELGIVDAIGGWIGDSVPAKFMPLMLVLVAGLLSYVVAASSVIYPLFAPMVPALAAASGLSPVLIAVSIMLGANISSFSPVSTGGSMAMLGASEEQRDIVMTGQFRFAMYFLIIFVAIFGVLGLLGVFG